MNSHLGEDMALIQLRNQKKEIEELKIQIDLLKMRVKKLESDAIFHA